MFFIISKFLFQEIPLENNFIFFQAYGWQCTDCDKDPSEPFHYDKKIIDFDAPRSSRYLFCYQRPLGAVLVDESLLFILLTNENLDHGKKNEVSVSLFFAK